ncbi:Hypothetical protein PACV_463 [Pacmanvirus A23]|uniref:Hypothetical protein n=1 Tax=Pacmanvirus A23 TaxID=1932881 RepID=UPI000A0933A0|nr:Hypothetical protein B9W72_gp460 [Pacmanvirus A23]SIP86175.1 Hypothetical protein PACV_463 [Pacmanvirus A23]
MGYEEQIDIIANMNAWQRNKLLKMVADMANERKTELEKTLAELDDKIKTTAEELEEVDAALLEAREKLGQAKLERDAADKVFLEFEKNPEEYVNQQQTERLYKFVEAHKVFKEELLKLARETNIRNHGKLMQAGSYYMAFSHVEVISRAKIWQSLGITDENIQAKYEELFSKHKRITSEFSSRGNRVETICRKKQKRICKDAYKKYMHARHEVSRCEAKFELLTEQLSNLKAQQKLAATELEEINA